MRLGGRFFGVRPETFDYLAAASQLGQPAKPEYPRELLPDAARMYARGWLNRPFFETTQDWVWPYWAVRQNDPADAGFVPWGFQPYHLNLAYRDWTAIGLPCHTREAVVDPRGLVTPWLDGWSLDTWLGTEQGLIVPARCPDDAVAQTVEPNPLAILTEIRRQSWVLRLRTEMVEDSAGGPWVAHQVSVWHNGPERVSGTLCLSLRPYNGEGVSLIKRIAFRDGTCHVNDRPALVAPPTPLVGCATYRDGDIAHRLDRLPAPWQADCPAGLATAVLAWPFTLAAGERWDTTVLMPLDSPAERPAIQTVVPQWKERASRRWTAALSPAMRIDLPDKRWQAAFDANRSYLLLMHDGESITPGPFTYHRFWFRDAAYLVHALGKTGFTRQAEEVLRSFPRRQRPDGYFRSQDGEWDSNGQAIWAMVEHFRLTRDRGYLADAYPSIRRGAEWIERKRRETESGLLPAGLSAEHFGPPDVYYWDDFWGLAGLRGAMEAAQALGHDADISRFRTAYESYWHDVRRSLDADAHRLGQPILPASPNRRPDAAMIGSLAACYPLRLIEPADEALANTLTALRRDHFVEQAFFQPHSHTALGTYLTLHVAHCLLFGRSSDAWPILQWFLEHASPTWTWAEGINPRSRHGGMGDGHHGWALADFLLLVRDLLLFEERDRLVITPLLPPGWAAPGHRIRVTDAPTHFGRVGFEIAFGEDEARLRMQSEFHTIPSRIVWHVARPIRHVAFPAEVSWEGSRIFLPGNCPQARVVLAAV